MKNIKRNFLSQNLSRARGREHAHKITVTVDELEAIGYSQDWKCALTGRTLEFSRGGTHWGGKWCNPYSCTIDRIDNNLGYTRDNVQLVTWYANKVKGHLNNDQFVELCRTVNKYVL